MKTLVKKSRIILRLFRLAIGIAGIVQGFLMKEFALSIAGFFLVYMAINHSECCGGNRSAVELEETQPGLNEMSYEKVDARL
jgi:hypothetical protein